MIRGADDRTRVMPAASHGLAGDQADSQCLNESAILRIAEPVQEKDGERELVGLVHLGRGPADEGSRALHGRIRCRHAALQEGQAR